MLGYKSCVMLGLSKLEVDPFDSSSHHQHHQRPPSFVPTKPTTPLGIDPKQHCLLLLVRTAIATVFNPRPATRKPFLFYTLNPTPSSRLLVLPSFNHTHRAGFANHKVTGDNTIRIAFVHFVLVSQTNQKYSICHFLPQQEPESPLQHEQRKSPTARSLNLSSTLTISHGGQ